MQNEVLYASAVSGFKKYVIILCIRIIANTMTNIKLAANIIPCKVLSALDMRG